MAEFYTLKGKLQGIYSTVSNLDAVTLNSQISSVAVYSDQIEGNVSTVIATLEDLPTATSISTIDNDVSTIINVAESISTEISTQSNDLSTLTNEVSTIINKQDIISTEISTQFAAISTALSTIIG